MTKHNKATATHARRGRAYAIVKHMAMECDYMAHQNDVGGFERFCDVLEDAAIMQSRDAELTFPFVTVAVPIEE